MRFVFLLLLAATLFGQRLEDLCGPCHTDQLNDFITHPHAAKKLSCDACHGVSEQHRMSGGSVEPDRVTGPHDMQSLCGTCHVAAQKAYIVSKHAKLVAERSKVRAAHCGTCHGTHALRAVAAMEAQCRRCHQSLSPANHPAAAGAATADGKLSCATCHDKHTLAAKK